MSQLIDSIFDGIEVANDLIKNYEFELFGKTLMSMGFKGSSKPITTDNLIKTNLNETYILIELVRRENIYYPEWLDFRFEFRKTKRLYVINNVIENNKCISRRGTDILNTDLPSNVKKFIINNLNLL